MYNRIYQSLVSVLSSRIFQILLGTGISILAAYLVARQVDVTVVQTTLQQVSLPAVISSIVSVIINTLLKALRWRLLLGPSGRNIPTTRLVSSLLGSQFLNALLPVRLGELSRAYDIGGMGAGRTYVLGGVFIEKIVDMAWLSILLIFVLVWLPLPEWLSQSAYVSLFAGIIVTLVMLVIVNNLDWLTRLVTQLVAILPQRIKLIVGPRMQDGLRSAAILGESGVQRGISIWSLAIWGTAILTNQLVLIAFNIHLPLTAACLILLSIMIGVTLPNVAAGFGIFEYMCVLSLGVFGVDADTALSYGLVLHFVVLLPMVLVGPVYLLGRRRAQNAGLV